MCRPKLFVLLVASILASVTIAFGDDGRQEKPPWYEWVKLSGELRTRFEGLFQFTRPKYPSDADSSLTFARARLKLEAKVSESIKAVIQFQDSRVWGEEPSTAANIGNIDLHQGYFEWQDINGSRLALKLGRQELSYGDERLIGAFGWSNVGRSFDAVKLSYLGGNYRIDGFHATTTETGPAAEDATFSGLYAIFENTAAGKLEAYALLKSDSRKIYASELTLSRESLSVQTLGFRLTGALPGSPLRYGAEVALQRGDFGDDDLEAWAGHFEAVYKTGIGAALQLRAEYNFASGDDDPADGTRGTFDNLFPTNHSKYGYIDFISWRNVKNLRLGATASPAKGHTVSLDFHKFWTATRNDHVYRASGAVLLPALPSATTSDVGQEIDITWRFSPAKGLGVLAGYSHFFAGELFEQAHSSGAVEDADFFYLQTLLRF